MELLLDTHVWLWSLLEPERLSARARELIASDQTRLHLSGISLWETLLLAERKRIILEPNAETWLQTAIVRSPVKEVPITFDVALASRSIRLSHGDPADRFIAASAKVFDLTLLTADRRLLKCRDIKALPS